MAPANIPDEMYAAVLDSYSGADALRVEKRPVPRPGKNEVLVKVAGTSIHPADLEFIKGEYGYFENPTPVVPGIVGCGTVVEAGSGFMARYLNGKRVQCVSKSFYQEEGDGAWAEYMVTSADYVLPLDKAVDLEQGATGSAINALSVMGMMDIVKKGGHKAIVQTAAASTMGRLVSQAASREGVKVVDVIRQEAQVESLKEQGASIVLNSRHSEFERQLQEACHRYDVHLAFDAVGGALTRQLLQAMPERSEVIIYGLLSGEPAQADMKQLVFQKKRINNYFIVSWLEGKNLIQSLLLWRRAQKLVASDLKTDIRARYPLQEIKQAVEEYQRQMTGGKMVLIPGEGNASIS
ncbi:MAG: zinc-binding dehydrogenase [Chloroflexota bacterium]|nr:MAG: zinc-binding dehydrogenase [Chloroflexota bacterium]